MSKTLPTVILCVDDDPRALVARSGILSIAGYDVQMASSSEAAMRIFSRCHVDVVIADSFLPGLTGAELASAMKEFEPELLFVMLTIAVEPALLTGEVDLVLAKGMEPRRFLGAIQDLLTVTGDRGAERKREAR